MGRIRQTLVARCRFKTLERSAERWSAERRTAPLPDALDEGAKEIHETGLRPIAPGAARIVRYPARLDALVLALTAVVALACPPPHRAAVKTE